MFWVFASFLLLSNSLVLLFVIRYLRHGALAKVETVFLMPFFRDCFDNFCCLSREGKFTYKQNAYIRFLISKHTSQGTKNTLRLCVDKHLGYEKKDQSDTPIKLFLRYLFLGTGYQGKVKEINADCPIIDKLELNKLNDEDQKTYLLCVYSLMMMSTYTIGHLYGITFRRVVMRAYTPTFRTICNRYIEEATSNKNIKNLLQELNGTNKIAKRTLQNKLPLSKASDTINSNLLLGDITKMYKLQAA